MVRVLLLIVLLLLFTRFCFAQEENAQRGYTYCEISEQETTQFEWRLESGNFVTLTVSRQEETHTCINNTALETIEWKLEGFAVDTAVIARREGNRIDVNGTLQGTPIREVFTIDEDPWYQAITLSLQPFSLSSQTSVEFWALRPDTLEVHKVKATKEGVELITFGDKEVEAQKVRISLTGFKAYLWHCFYWYRTKDGRFMRYEGSFGLPGLPKKTIIFMEEVE